MAAPKCVVSRRCAVGCLAYYTFPVFFLAVWHFVGGRDLTGWRTETILPNDSRASKTGRGVG